MNIYNSRFSHIYVENNISDREETRRILDKFPNAAVIGIRHYKDVFNRRRQNFSLQHRSQALIIAENKGRLIFSGADVCQSFGEENFYYTSPVMNCIYDCEYCFLKGMYPSGNMVIFINTEDYFREAGEILKKGKCYISLSYDCDLCSIEEITGIIGKWHGFLRENPDLTVEVRTKSGNQCFKDLSPIRQMIFAFTLTPEEIIRKYEKGTAGLSKRLENISSCIERGFPVRVCLDPLIYTENFKTDYGEMLDKLKSIPNINMIRDISIGTFRIGETYMKNMRKMLPNSALVQFPYENRSGVYSYPARIEEKMLSFIRERLSFIDKEKIFEWKG